MVREELLLAVVQTFSAEFHWISLTCSEESSSWELPTALSLADSYFHNSSFLWGNRKPGSRWRYSELPATVKIPGFQRVTPFVKWRRDVIGRKIIEQPVLRRCKKPTEAAPARLSTVDSGTVPAHTFPLSPSPNCPYLCIPSSSTPHCYLDPPTGQPLPSGFSVPPQRGNILYK